MLEINSILTIRCLSSLSKVFADEELHDDSWNSASALSNETYSFQVAYRSERLLKSVQVRTESALNPHVNLRLVGLVPSELPGYHDSDEHILRSTPGLYPDPLYPLTEDGVTAPPNQWRSVWVTVDPQGNIQAGSYPIEVIFSTNDGQIIGSTTFNLTILASELPAQSLIHTEWIHTDCLANYYNVKVFSEAYWGYVERYIQTATNHGINMILTPLFTPPLDTVVGGERPTVQLVGVEQTKSGGYQFDFSQLQRWIDLCTSCGVEYFEFSHFFTQWGAKHAPKVVCSRDGELQLIFGWETDAGGGEYKSFLKIFIPELLQFIQENHLEHRCFFHVSDEPNMDHLESYQRASTVLHECLGEYPVIDALSDFAFYELGIVKQPIPSNDHMELFLKEQIPDLWMYYCCGQYKGVSNRFFNMPSSRNRIIGFQLFKFNIKGFLHWGYNFWNTQYSLKAIDPYQVTDAGCAFPSGDAFLVYPGQKDPVESIRLEVFYEALQDMRALQLLEQWLGRDRVIAIIEEDLPEELTLTNYPRDHKWLLMKRERLNQLIKEHGVLR